MDERIEELYTRGKELFDKGEYREAERLLIDVVKVYPNYADVHNKLGVINHMKGDLSRAAKHFEMALAINPKYTEASLNLAVTYNDTGNFDKAKEVFLKAAQIACPEPYNIDPFIKGRLSNEHAKLGSLYHDLGLYDEAVEEYKKALRMSPNFVDVVTKAGIAYRDKGMYDDAVAEFIRAKQINPRYLPAWIHLGITYYMKGFVGMAVEEWEKALEIDPEGKEAHMYLKFVRRE